VVTASAMTEQEAEDFVDRFAAAWSARDGNAFLALWHPDGQLHYPFANHVLKGSEIGMLNDLLTANAPHLRSRLLIRPRRCPIGQLFRVIEVKNPRF
jgi:hypothetical protein